MLFQQNNKTKRKQNKIYNTIILCPEILHVACCLNFISSKFTRTHTRTFSQNNDCAQYLEPFSRQANAVKLTRNSITRTQHNFVLRIVRKSKTPLGHSGKAKRGHLCFDAAFETGNLGRVDLVGEFEYDLFLRPDTCNPRYRFWFNFTVDNVKQDQRVIFNIVNMNKSRNLFKDGMTPLVKSTSRPKWQRLPRCEVFYYKSPVHQNHYVLSFAFGFDKEDEVYQFALTFPYSYSKMQAYLNAVELKFPEAFERSSLGMSIQNRKLELITFDDVKKPDKMDPKNVIHMVVILARIHPGESPASYVVQGLIEFLAAANQPISKALREHVVFKIVPMLNPDGVFLGNNRCNVIGHDLNRSWNRLSQYTHPTLSAVMKMLKEYDNSSTCESEETSPARFWSITGLPTFCPSHPSTSCGRARAGHGRTARGHGRKRAARCGCAPRRPARTHRSATRTCPSATTVPPRRMGRRCGTCTAIQGTAEVVVDCGCGPTSTRTSFRCPTYRRPGSAISTFPATSG
ncbi:cytosolic carboxypeptidase 6 isoform X5 [Anopheles merus]|uniref:cytosolic carboxypeptidase 6 isoform X5 n=1 Tax=Anopheles merus TaxID=30066 RepID=UPI001BE42C6F|nr:cytosolic carboxypeptidase 6 isoform X5 [Anopheles merus]